MKRMRTLVVIKNGIETMNGTECVACGYITCQCDRLKREQEETYKDEIRSLKKQLMEKDKVIIRLNRRLNDISGRC